MCIFVAFWSSVKPVLWNSQNRSHLLTESSRCSPPTSVKGLNDDFWPSYYPGHRQDPREPWVSWMLSFSHFVMSGFLWLCGLKVARLPCPPPSTRVCSKSCSLSRWCHPTISSSVTLFSSCIQSFPESGSFPMSHFFISGGQSIGVSASASVFPMNIQDWFPLGWTGWISLKSKGLSRVFSNTIVQKHQFLGAQPSLGPTLTSVHDYSKYHSSDYTHLHFKTLSRFVIAFLNVHIPKSSWWNLTPNVMVSDEEPLRGGDEVGAPSMGLVSL